MAGETGSKAQVWLAMALGVVVLVASVVAVSRMSDRSDMNPSATGPEDSSAPGGAPPAPALSGPSGLGSGAGSGAVGQAAETVAGAGEAASAAVAPGGQKRVPKAAGSGSRPSAASSSATGGQPAPAESGAGGSDASAGSQGPGADGGGSQGGGQASPPAPSQQPPDETPLVGASASAGEGARGGVVGVAVDSAGADADVTVGTTPLVGNHPPSEGTGITFGSRFVQPPPAIPTLSG